MTTPPPSDPFRSPAGSWEGSPWQGGPPTGGHQAGWPGAAAPGGYGPPPQQWGGPGGPGWGGPGGQPRTETKAIIALVLAIGSWVLFPLLPAIAALVVGSSARREIDASGGWLTGDGLVTAAKAVAWANIVLCLLGVVLAVLALGLFATTGVTTTS